MSVGSHKIAEAYVELVWKDHKYYAGLAAAKKALDQFKKQANTLGGNISAASVTAKFDAIGAGAKKLATRLGTAAAAANALHKSLQAVSRVRMPNLVVPAGTASNPAAIIRAYGSAFKSAATGVGQGFGAAIRNALSGGGTGTGSAIRGLGAGLKQAAQGFASVLRASIGATSGLIRALNGTISTLASSARTIVATVLSPFRSLMKVGSIAGLVGGGLSLYGASNASADMESRMVALQRITGSTNQEMVKLGGAIKSLGNTMPVSLSNITDIAEIGARMDIKSNALPLFTADIAKLSVVLDQSELPIKEATERIGSLLTVFKRGHEDALRFGSALVRLDQMSVATARDILDISNRFSGSASIFGMKPQEVLAVSAALRQARVPVETAGTNMGQLLARMASRRDMKEFAKLTRMSRDDFATMLRTNPMNLIKQLASSISKMDPITANRSLDKLHLDGQRVRLMLMGLAQVSGQLDTYLSAANEEWQTMGAVLNGFDQQAATANAQWDLMVNRIKLLGVELGRGLLPIMKGFTEGFGLLAIEVRTFVDTHGKSLEEWGKRIGEWLSNASGLFSNFHNILKTTGQVASLLGTGLRDSLGNVLSEMPGFLANAAKELGLSLGTAIVVGLETAINDSDMMKGLLGALGIGGGAIALGAAGLGAAGLGGRAAAGAGGKTSLLGKVVGAGKWAAAGLASKIPGLSAVMGAPATAGGVATLGPVAGYAGYKTGGLLHRLLGKSPLGFSAAPPVAGESPWTAGFRAFHASLFGGDDQFTQAPAAPAAPAAPKKASIHTPNFGFARFANTANPLLGALAQAGILIDAEGQRTSAEAEASKKQAALAAGKSDLGARIQRFTSPINRDTFNGMLRTPATGRAAVMRRRSAGGGAPIVGTLARAGAFGLGKLLASPVAQPLVESARFGEAMGRVNNPMVNAQKAWAGVSGTQSDADLAAAMEAMAAHDLMGVSGQRSEVVDARRRRRARSSRSNAPAVGRYTPGRYVPNVGIVAGGISNASFGRRSPGPAATDTKAGGEQVNTGLGKPGVLDEMLTALSGGIGGGGSGKTAWR